MKKNNVIGPSNPQERMILLDVIRGFAIFGILLVNTPLLNSPVLSDFFFINTHWDSIVINFIYLLAIDKFYPIFSLLFGISAIIFMENAAQQGCQPIRLFIRRMVILFFFGVIHAFFIWWGDILIVYAILGILLAFFYYLPPRYLIVIALVFFMILTAIHIHLAYNQWWESFYYPNDLMIEESNLIDEAVEELDNSDLINNEKRQLFAYDNNDEENLDNHDEKKIYQAGSFQQITQQRINDYYTFYLAGLVHPDDNNNFLSYISYYLHIFTIFLLGAWVQKEKLFQNLENNWSFIVKIAGYSTFLAFMTNFLSEQSGFWEEVLIPFRGLSLAIVYIFVITFLFKKVVWQQRLLPLASVGKMSLSNYIGGNLLLSLLFYGYGLGLYSTIGPGIQIGFTLIIFLAIALFSLVWLRYYRFGPLEYIWRLLTYGKV